MVNFRKFAGYSLVALFVLLLVAAIALPIGFRSYLHSEAFRLKIGAAAGKALKAEAEIQPPQLAGSTAYTDGFKAHGSLESAFRELKGDQIRADFNWHGLLRRKWQIDEITVEKLEVDLAEPNRPRPPRATPVEASPGTQVPQGPKWQFDLRKVSVRDSRWRWGGVNMPAGEVAHAALNVTPSDDNAWLIAVTDGKLRQTGWPEVAVDSAHLRYREGNLFLTESRLHQGSGFATVTGEIDPKQRLDLQVVLEGVDVNPLLTGDWRARLTGRIFGDATIRAGLGDNKAPLSITGSARLNGGQLTALPVLDQIATFTQTQRFRTVALSTASCDFTQEGDRFTARHIIAEAEGLMRVEGGFTLVAGQIDGTFEVGVTAASLHWLPGSQSRVFTTARNGYYWAPMRLTGPVDHPNEDLTGKLAQAAAGQVIDTVGGAVKDATKAARDTAKGLLDSLLR
jgi:hypothetical protein